ncbi:YHS domain-containing protein [Glycomyces sp. YM15]|uniref:YHS domain-containing protein n=1 Tax=Glycomyces sp. YM15 TaxID=2800446 RepID=UPI001965E692|nr:YHS domain-containing protein [Glycomyces sp. YM15]
MCNSEASGCHTDTATEAGTETAECPVMRGSLVVKSDAEAAGLFRDYGGRRYWFCCAGCGPAFDADPAKYATAA